VYKLIWILVLSVFGINVFCVYQSCYASSPFEGFLIDSEKNNSHYVSLLNNGDDALLARVDLIRKAKESILIQTFIWGSDETSRFMAYELIQAAKRGVKVKIILDYLMSSKDFKLITFLTTVHPNIEIKLYNPLSKNIVPSKFALIKKAFLNFRNFNQRMHNKIFIVDNQIAITGGRNYQNDYYDRGTARNFKDCGVAITGKLVNEMTDSFQEYWAHPLSVLSESMADVRRLIETNNYKKYSSRESLMLSDLFTELEACHADESCLKKRILDISYEVKKIRFISDRPGKNERIGRERVTKTTYELGNFFQQAEKSLVIQTPYVVIGTRNTRYFKKLAKDKPELKVLISSNSLSSADHIHAYAFSYKNKKKYLKIFGWQMFELKLRPRDIDLMITPINKEKRSKDYITCLHSKIYVVDSQKVWIGSFNLDPRSANLNTEVGVIIDDKAVAQAIEADIRRDMANQNSWTVAKRKQLPVISHFSELLSNIMDFVPIVDIWPFTYSGSFELKPGKAALEPSNKDFYNNYKYFGPFPDVQLIEKEVKARLIKTFMGPIQPLL